MKRLNNCFESVIDYRNIRLAFLKALRGNRSSPAAAAFCHNTDANLAAVRDRLASLDCGWGGYRSFVITGPKLRVISTAPFEQRIMHHAIINVIEDTLNRPMIHHSYACRKNKGTHAAVLYAFRQCKSRRRFLKLDIRAYFDSIDHAALKMTLRRLIKDTRLIALLDGVIDSYRTGPARGLPIGNLTSQYFANLYLAGLDHFILEQLRPAGYCRYMDDFVLWAHENAPLNAMLARIEDYAAGHLRLALKTPVSGPACAGLPFLGFLIKGTGIFLLQKSKKRLKTRMRHITGSLAAGDLSEAKAAERAQSVFAAVNLARTAPLRRKLCQAEVE